MVLRYFAEGKSASSAGCRYLSLESEVHVRQGPPFSVIPQAVAEDQSEMAVAMVREAVEAEMIPMIPVMPEMVILGILRLKDLQVMKVGMEIAKRPTEILD